MKLAHYVVPVGVLILAACGGGEITDQQQQNNLHFLNAERPDTSELNGIFPETRPTVANFDDANTRPLQAPQGGGAVYYEGTMLARKGQSSEFMHGDIGITFNLNAGNGTGDVTNITISGDDTQDRQMSFFGENVDVLITSVNGTSMSGTMTGTFEEDTAVVNPIFDTYTVDADLDGRFVAGTFGGMVGTVDGTITSTIGGVESLEGVYVGEEDPFGS